MFILTIFILYSTIKLFQDLEKGNIYACGTIRKDRGKFQQEFREKFQRGEMKLLRADNVVAVHWFDKHDVYAVSTSMVLAKVKSKDVVTRNPLTNQYDH